MKNLTLVATVALLSLAAIETQAQSVTFDFAGGSNQGWSAGGFSGTTPLTVSTINSANYIFAPVGGFQVANVASGYTGTPAGFNAAMQAALINPSAYTLSYNWSVNTANITGASYLQLGFFLNSGSGYYQQSYGSPNQVQLNGTQLTSGQTISGSVSINLATAFPTFDSGAGAETFWRLGIIANGDGTGNGGYFNDISLTPTAVPEPTTLALAGLGGISMLFLRRRNA
ncbi:MAG TPA: PEP-CTERM sorting domain-containing protein [Pseudomonadales bacterium]|nr:PEP-CTERM sorting domain-containing protein [Pseudomonadales bacterium]